MREDKLRLINEMENTRFRLSGMSKFMETHPEECGSSELRKLHSTLYSLICKVGTSERKPNGHGKYWNVELEKTYNEYG